MEKEKVVTRQQVMQAVTGSKVSVHSAWQAGMAVIGSAAAYLQWTEGDLNWREYVTVSHSDISSELGDWVTIHLEVSVSGQQFPEPVLRVYHMAHLKGDLDALLDAGALTDSIREGFGAIYRDKLPRFALALSGALATRNAV